MNTAITIKCWLESATACLSARTDDPYQDSKRDAVVLLCQVLNKNEAYLRAFDDTLLTQTQLSQLESYLSQRLNGEPIAYILGEREFWSLPLNVNASTLIPRADTECLIEFALSLFSNKMQQPLNILDLGTGTGAIAFALAKELHAASIIGVDKSIEAIQLAKSNQKRLQERFGGFEHVNFWQSDWFSAFVNKYDVNKYDVNKNDVNKNEFSIADQSLFSCTPINQPAANQPAANQPASRTMPMEHYLNGVHCFDLIISNPPYIAEDDIHLQQGDVRFEPRSALVAKENGLSDIKLIIKQSYDFLKSEGYLILEHGWQQADQVRQLLLAEDYQSVESHQDYAGQFRFTVGRKKTNSQINK